MKVTKDQLLKIIEEEIEAVLGEGLGTSLPLAHRIMKKRSKRKTKRRKIDDKPKKKTDSPKEPVEEPAPDSKNDSEKAKKWRKERGKSTRTDLGYDQDYWDELDRLREEESQ